LRHELTHEILRQGLHLDALCPCVLPEHPDRVGCPLAGSRGGQDEELPVGGELMQEGSRGIVEQVRVVDADHEAVSSGTGRERVSDQAQKVQPADRGRKSFGKKVAEGAKGNRCAGPGGDHPRRGGSGLFGSALQQGGRDVVAVLDASLSDMAWRHSMAVIIVDAAQ